MADIGVVVDPDDAVANSVPVVLATERLSSAISGKGRRFHRFSRRGDIPEDWPTLVVAAAENSAARLFQESERSSVPVSPESVAIVPIQTDSAPILLVSGSDTRGLTYAVHEMADRFEYSADGAEALRIDQPINSVPANRVRSVTRLFCSEIEDKAWWYDETFWDSYLSMLVAQRFNRFSLTLGLGYNYPEGVTDAYFYFAYPFLVDVSGFDVRVPELADGERDRNLAMLRYVSERTHAHGLNFQLGLWTHAYRWVNSPHAQHTVTGLTAADHGKYCREAIRALLESCPAIDGVTLRIHGESGVPERSWSFWQNVFEGIAACGRPVEIDLHAKGLDERVLQDALGTGLPVTVSPKFWAEHMGLPYHQAAIREAERPPRADPSHLSEWHSHMAISEGSRPYTRYGYGDFLKEDRSYDLVFRVWAGTQRILLWGDPVFAAGYGRAAGIGGSAGLELMEPLTFRGREGTGIGGTRTGYADADLVPRYDWQKYTYTYRLWGRLSYDPDESPDTWRRFLAPRFGPNASATERALSKASRILPLVTVAHHQSASNNYYWPEMYTTMPIVEKLASSLEDFLIDTPAPKRFGTVESLDPEVFSTVAGYVDEVLEGELSGRLNPLQVASLLDQLSNAAEEAAASIAPGQDAERLRWYVDVAVQTLLGRFFAAKLRAATFYEIHLRTGELGPLRAAQSEYRTAATAWSNISTATRGVYQTDVPFGPQAWLRGHWENRWSSIDADIRAMADRLDRLESDARTVDWSPPGSHDIPPVVKHVPPQHYHPGKDLTLFLEAAQPESVTAAEVRFRPMSQALAWKTVQMEPVDGRYSARIRASEVDTSYPLSYAFVVRYDEVGAWRLPGLGDDLSGQPYYIVRRLDRRM